LSVGRWPRVVASTLLILILGIPGTAFAVPDFSQTTITLDSPAMVAGGFVSYLIRVRNSGDEAAPFAELRIELPLEALLAEVSGLDADAIVDLDNRSIDDTIELASGGERIVRLRFVLPRDAAGMTVALGVRARYLYRNVSFETASSADVGSAPASGGIALGRFRLQRASLAVVAMIVLYPLLRFATRSRVKGYGPAIATMIGVGFLSFFVAMAWTDWQTVTTFHESTCTILDRRLRVTTETSRTPRQLAVPRRSTADFQPILALRYHAEEQSEGTQRGRDIVSTGYDTDSRLGIGGAGRAAREYEQWKIGRQVRCWFDPEDPGRVVVIRGFGGAYVFAILPALLLAYGLRSLVRGRE
jgi:hypothetical protein